MFTTATATKIQSLQPSLTLSAELQLLNVFVGQWQTEGLSYGSGQARENPYDSPVRWSGAETYEWLPGGFFLVHHFEAQIGDAVYNAAEIIGYDASSQTYPVRAFGNYGSIHSSMLSVCDGAWTLSTPGIRGTFVFSDDGNTITNHLDWLSGEGCLHLADLKLTKVK
jgi:Protein of unknown function (DUF1579)